MAVPTLAVGSWLFWVLVVVAGVWALTYVAQFGLWLYCKHQERRVLRARAELLAAYNAADEAQNAELEQSLRPWIDNGPDRSGLAADLAELNRAVTTLWQENLRPPIERLVRWLNARLTTR